MHKHMYTVYIYVNAMVMFKFKNSSKHIQDHENFANYSWPEITEFGLHKFEFSKTFSM